MQDQESAKSDVAKKEEEILKFWQENKIFEKTLAQDHKNPPSHEATEGRGEFVFYDGPPFATGLPHYGHILASTIKDVVPRYYAMKGYHVPRRWGWDCHGLPVENLIEAELDLKTKKDIEEYGIGKFNEKARASVMAYAEDWKRVIPRLGRFVDMEDDYKTMDWKYSQTVWWIFKSLHDKGLIYEGYKSMQICPRCETTLANFEVNQGYKDITDISVTLKFKVQSSKFKVREGDIVLAWTTTPWTLPGNVALAIGPKIEYGRFSKDGDVYILAKARAEAVLKEGYELLDDVGADDLVGLAYKPVFDYYQDPKLENFANGWKIYGADFVMTEDGTGVVHIAPAFGEEDMTLGKANNLPFIQHVAMNGQFKKEVKEWAGRQVKPRDTEEEKDKHQEIDIEIIKHLAGKGTLFAKEKMVHSYPHCWRCKTPLLNYATTSWFVKVTDIKDRLVAVNNEICWVPEHIKEGRFGKWLEGARDWAISRSRFWGAPIPVWKCGNEDCTKIKVIDKMADFKDSTANAKNTYIVMRHGEAESNLNDLVSSQPGNTHHLTEKGKGEAKEAGEKLKDRKIDLIFTSDFVRTKETAEIVAEEIGLDKTKIILDPRLREQNAGVFDGKTWKEFIHSYPTKKERLTVAPEGGETPLEVKHRVMEFFYELNDKYQGKNILVVSHGLPLVFMSIGSEGLSQNEIVKKHNWGTSFANAEFRDLDFYPLPHNKHFEVDQHRPFIDEVEFICECGGVMKRVPDVFDCWFESGSMPYGESHYPLENKDIFDPETGKGFPADFIGEGTDQTRGWFYSMLVLSTALFDTSSFRSVIVNGMIMAEDGQKMSKSLRNYPDPELMINKYGADALRFYLLSSPVVRAEDLNFSEKGLGELYRKVVMRLANVFSFYRMYEGNSKLKTQNSKLGDTKSCSILDRWILAKLNKLIADVDRAMGAYELDRATRPIDEFIDDLSNWYLRRSRDRFKSDDVDDRASAIATMRDVLVKLSRVIAPFMPFIADEIYRDLAGGKESVHLESWPEAEQFDEKLLAEMNEAREAVTLGLEARAKAGIKVRQPLASITLKKKDLDGKTEILALIKDELNVKDVLFGETGEAEVVLDTNITPELKEEGDVRELIRSVQDLRKQKGLEPSDLVTLKISTNEAGQAFVKKFEKEITKATMLKAIEFDEAEGDELKIGELAFRLALA